MYKYMAKLISMFNKTMNFKRISIGLAIYLIKININDQNIGRYDKALYEKYLNMIDIETRQIILTHSRLFAKSKSDYDVSIVHIGSLIIALNYHLI